MPKGLSSQNQDQQTARHPLRPVFRDQDDMAAGHNLTQTIRSALEQSNALIVLCSPAAAQSKWVNEEIRLFRQLHNDEQIFCAIVDGSPQTAFPPALTDDGRSEPLAADLQPSGDGKSLGTLKLKAGLLGVSLDELRRRDLQHKYRRTTALSALSIAIAGAMSVMTVSAVKARQEASARTADAEGLIEFMLTDLKDKLEPVGRLDVLDVVGERAMAYYDGQQDKALSPESLSRKARTFHMLGGIDQKLGRSMQAQSQYEKAYAATKQLLDDAPNDPKRIYDHAQSAYWVGEGMLREDPELLSLPYFSEYLHLAEQLISIDPEDTEHIRELAYAHGNIGMTYDRIGQYNAAFEAFILCRDNHMRILKRNPTDESAISSLGYANEELMRISLRTQTLPQAQKYAENAREFLQGLLEKNDNNYKIKMQLAGNEIDRAHIQFELGNINIANSIALQNLERINAVIDRDPANTFNYPVYFQQVLLLIQYNFVLDKQKALDYFAILETTLDLAPQNFKENLSRTSEFSLGIERTQLKLNAETRPTQMVLRQAETLKSKALDLKTKLTIDGDLRGLDYNYAVANLYIHDSLIKLGRKDEAQALAIEQYDFLQDFPYPGAEFDCIRIRILQMNGHDDAANEIADAMKAKGYKSPNRKHNLY